MQKQSVEKAQNPAHPAEQAPVVQTKVIPDQKQTAQKTENKNTEQTTKNPDPKSLQLHDKQAIPVSSALKDLKTHSKENIRTSTPVAAPKDQPVVAVAKAAAEKVAAPAVVVPKNSSVVAAKTTVVSAKSPVTAASAAPTIAAAPKATEAQQKAVTAKAVQTTQKEDITTAAELKKQTEVKNKLSKTAEYKSAVKDTFAKFDGNGNGRINQGELQQLIVALGYQTSQDELKVLIASGDKNEDGEVEPKEMTYILGGKFNDKTERDTYLQKFKIYDQNNNGLITAKNIKNVSDMLGQQVDQKGIEILIAKVNLDPHGSFNFEQYMQIMAKNTKEMINPGLVYTEMLLDKVVTKVTEVQNYNQDQIDDILENSYTKSTEFGSKVFNKTQEKLEEGIPIVIGKVQEGVPIVVDKIKNAGPIAMDKLQKGQDKVVQTFHDVASDINVDVYNDTPDEMYGKIKKSKYMDIKKYWHEWLIIGATIFFVLFCIKKLLNCFFGRNRSKSYANQIDDLSVRSARSARSGDHNSGRGSKRSVQEQNRNNGSELWDFRSGHSTVDFSRSHR